MRTIIAFCAIILACGILGCGESGPPADNSNVKTPAPPPPPGGAPSK